MSLWRLILLAETEYCQHDNGQYRQPNRGTTVGGFGELDQIGQPANQQGHTGHYCVAERRTEGDHEEENSSPCDRSAWPRMLN